MVHCKSCIKNVQADYVDGKICCPLCGRVIDEDNFSSEPTFVKDGGQSRMAGNYVRAVSDYSASRERTLNEALYGIESIMCALAIDGGDSIAHAALKFYTIALDRNFTRGRRKEQVEAACLYVACRVNKKPFLLIDFSEYLQINVYVLGAVFLQLCKLLSLTEHLIIQKPVDPSLFIHRFTDRLVGGRNPSVSRTALRIVARMKLDWMQTGRKPSGICGAALYISALSHGLKCSKFDIIKIVRVCEATLTKRLIEFESTESSSLTIEEFNIKAQELEKEERPSQPPSSNGKMSGINELLCEHKDKGRPHFAHGLCESCYADFIELSGGLDGGSEPPAFQRAEKERIMASQAANENPKVHDDVITSHHMESNSKCSNFEEYNGDGNPKIPGSESGVDGMIHDTCQDPESLSDIDDVEVDGYLHNEEEKYYKKIIWEEMNREYLEEQAAKEAAALAAKKAYEANSHGCPEDMQAARELAAAAAEAVAKSRKERKQKRDAEMQNLGPAQTAAEAARQMLARKRLSSKINYDVLDKLFDETEIPEAPKKARTVADMRDAEKLKDDRKLDPIQEDTFDEEEIDGGSYNHDKSYENDEEYDAENYDFDE